MLKAVGLRAVIGEDLRQHRGGWLKPGFQALLVHRLGVFSSVCRQPLRAALLIVSKVGFLLCRNVYGIELPRSVNVGRRLELGHQHGIVIHTHARIGDDCVIRQGVTFGAGIGWIEGQGPVIGNRVHFGVGTVVVGNVTIGDDVTIGPNCVISRDVPANCTLFVPPPRMIPKQTPEPSASLGSDPESPDRMEPKNVVNA